MSSPSHSTAPASISSMSSAALRRSHSDSCPSIRDAAWADTASPSILTTSYATAVRTASSTVSSSRRGASTAGCHFTPCMCWKKPCRRKERSSAAPSWRYSDSRTSPMYRICGRAPRSRYATGFSRAGRSSAYSIPSSPVLPMCSIWTMRGRARMPRSLRPSTRNFARSPRKISPHAASTSSSTGGTVFPKKRSRAAASRIAGSAAKLPMNTSRTQTSQGFFAHLRMSLRDASERIMGDAGGWFFFFGIIYIILIFKVVSYESLSNHVFFGFYSLLITTYILSRFLLAYLRKPIRVDLRYEPTITFVVPAKDEEDNIAETIRRFGAVEYPHEKIEVIAINDGSTDGTLVAMQKATEAIRHSVHRVEVVDFRENRGKRQGMAEGVKRARHYVVIFVDSDSFIEPSAVRHLVKYFADPSVGAVSGHTDVWN